MTFYLLLLLFVVYKITNSKNETRLFLNGKNLDKSHAVSLFNNTTNISSFYPKSVIAVFEQPLVYQITSPNYSDANTVVIKDEKTIEIPNNTHSVKSCRTRKCKRNERRKRRRQNSLLAYTMAAAIIMM